jgi:hypothetical protein
MLIDYIIFHGKMPDEIVSVAVAALRLKQASEAALASGQSAHSGKLELAL